MPFPEKRRVVYKKNPLNSVTCQLRFPPILKIDSDLPSAFQDTIRQEYPLYNEKIQYQQQIAANMMPPFPQAIIRPLNYNPLVTKIHEFCTNDNRWIITLTRTYLSISTPKYNRCVNRLLKMTHHRRPKMTHLRH
jgi:uncharacterized protein (TIGR04255 family)